MPLIMRIVEGKIFSLGFFLCAELNVLPHLFNLLLKVTYSYRDIKKRKKKKKKKKKKRKEKKRKALVLTS